MFKGYVIRIVFFVVIQGYFQMAYSGYGDPQDTLPSAFEREVHVMTNAVRMDPLGFRDTYISGTTILNETSYPSVAPLAYNQNLSRSARAHSVDMAANCGLQHESCDGTSFAKRVTSFYKSSSSIAENIATGKATGIQTVVQWLRDDVQGKPAADLSGSDGHRKNMMNANYKELGVGYAYSASRQWNHFWTQDFGAGSAVLYKIPAGCHFKPNNTTLSFAANYYDPTGVAPKSSVVIFDNNVNQMKIMLGSPAKGTYSYSITDDKKVHCYYFIFVDGSGAEIRFPENATLTTGSGLSCSSSAIMAHPNKKTSCVTGKRKGMDAPFFTLNGVRITGKLVMYRRASGVFVGEKSGNLKVNQ
jgi:hypothetical protein